MYMKYMKGCSTTLIIKETGNATCCMGGMTGRAASHVLLTKAHRPSPGEGNVAKPAASHVLGAAQAVRLELLGSSSKGGGEVGSSSEKQGWQGKQEPGPEAGTLGE